MQVYMALASVDDDEAQEQALKRATGSADSSGPRNLRTLTRGKEKQWGCRDASELSSRREKKGSRDT